MMDVLRRIRTASSFHTHTHAHLVNVWEHVNLMIWARQNSNKNTIHSFIYLFIYFMVCFLVYKQQSPIQMNEGFYRCLSPKIKRWLHYLNAKWGFFFWNSFRENRLVPLDVTPVCNLHGLLPLRLVAGFFNRWFRRGLILPSAVQSTCVQHWLLCHVYALMLTPSGMCISPFCSLRSELIPQPSTTQLMSKAHEKDCAFSCAHYRINSAPPTRRFDWSKKLDGRPTVQTDWGHGNMPN